jgi:hypothetical protein
VRGPVSPRPTYAAQRGDHRSGGSYFGVADGEIEDIFGAALAAELHSDLKHAADPRGLFHLLGDRTGDSQSHFRSLI